MNTSNSSRCFLAALSVILILAPRADAFASPPLSRPNFPSRSLLQSAESADDAPVETESPASTVSTPSDVPAAEKSDAPPAVAKKAKRSNPHPEGVFSPLVVVATTLVGPARLKELRAKFIGVHSDVIKSFVDTSDSEFGKSVLRQIFEAVDIDGNGQLDKEEMGQALNLLGFKWLEEKHIDRIFNNADADKNGYVDIDEFVNAAPKTLKQNLIKLAKTNGGDMGLLV